MSVRNFPSLGRTRVIGIVNVTPDSFSDGGRFDSAEAAVRAGLQMLNEGADVLDVGGESTRPGAVRVSEADERDRVEPVVAGLVAAGARVSVDTARASVAEAALDAGAVLVNDVSGGADPAMFPLIAARGVPYVLMHSRGPSVDMRSRAFYRDLIREMTVELAARLETALAAGIDTDQIILDPGIGFAKTADHNWTVLAMLDRLFALGRPLLVGTSRKSFLGALLADVDGTPRPVLERDDATQAMTALVAAAGAWAVRVHAVRPASDAVRVAAALLTARRAAGR
ncbi:MAG TPA: dihydropteroate synthase [Frankiaceae bacterium]|nr:dihydropteroate synthase [Frankiaceae bacterium]